MKKKVYILLGIFVFVMVCSIKLNTVVKAEENPYSEMTVLDISKGKISIDVDCISGYGEDGSFINEVNPNGYHIISSSSSTSNKITVQAGVRTTIVADHLNIVNYSTDETEPSPLFIRPGASVTLILEGENKFSGADYNAAIGVPQASDGTMAELIIEGSGSAICRTGKRGAGIGGGQKCGYTEGAGIITINSGTIDTVGGDYGGGIGNAERNGNKNCQITINGGIIKASSNNQSNGIGGSRDREPGKADIIINGGIIYASGPNNAIRGASIQYNGGNVVALLNGNNTNWQHFNVSPLDQAGNSVRFASIQLDKVDRSKELSITCGDHVYSIMSDDQARVNIPLFQGTGDVISLSSTTGNVYGLDYSTLASSTVVTDRPYSYPVLTITPDQNQSIQYGETFIPTYKVYQDDGSVFDDADNAFSGSLGYQVTSTWYPQTVEITSGDIQINSSSYCFTLTPDITAEITKRNIAVSVDDLEVLDGIYSRYNLPFQYRLEEGTLASGDTLESIMDSINVAPNEGSDYYRQGVYPNLEIYFNSANYEITLKGNKPTLTVLENECLFKQGDRLQFGKDSSNHPVKWIVANELGGNILLYSENVYDQFTFEEAKQVKNNAISYIIDKFPTLTEVSYFIVNAEIMDNAIVNELFLDSSFEQQATDAEGNPAKYWMFTEDSYPYQEQAVYRDENGEKQVATDDTLKAGVRIVMLISTRTHTLPQVTLDESLTSHIEYGMIEEGTIIGHVKDTAAIIEHKTESFSLVSSSDDFTLQEDGSIIANRRLNAGEYLLSVRSIDDTGYETESAISFTVEPRQIEILPQSNISFSIGESLPEIPYSYDESRLLQGDTLIGSLAIEGELTQGDHKITLGTLSAGANYRLVLSKEEMITILDKPKIPTQDENDHQDEKEQQDQNDGTRDQIIIEKEKENVLTGDQQIPVVMFFMTLLAGTAFFVIKKIKF